MRNCSSGSAAVMDIVATVSINGLVCEKIYIIIAGGVDSDGNLVGPQFHQETVTAGPCPRSSIVTTTMPTGKIYIMYIQIYIQI